MKSIIVMVCTIFLIVASAMPLFAQAPGMEFVADMTVPEDTVMQPREQFKTTWRVLNSGDINWTENYSIVFSEGDLLGADTFMPLALVPPGVMADIIVNMQAPANPGTYRGVWQLQDDSGVLFGPPFHVQIVVAGQQATWPAQIEFDLDSILGLVPATVVSVDDGDSIDVSIDGEQYTLRYAGMDTSEEEQEPTERNRQLVEGQVVYLEKDVTDVDEHGRLLRYVYLSSGLMVNAALVWEGYAEAVAEPPDVKHQVLLEDLQEDAQTNGRGLWEIPEPQEPTEEPAPEPTEAAQP